MQKIVTILIFLSFLSNTLFSQGLAKFIGQKTTETNFHIQNIITPSELTRLFPKNESPSPTVNHDTSNFQAKITSIKPQIAQKDSLLKVNIHFIDSLNKTITKLKSTKPKDKKSISKQASDLTNIKNLVIDKNNQVEKLVKAIATDSVKVDSLKEKERQKIIDSTKNANNAKNINDSLRNAEVNNWSYAY